MRLRRSGTPSPRLTVDCEPVLRAGAPAQVEVTVDGEHDGDVRVFLRLLGWDRRRAERWPLAVTRGSRTLTVDVPTGLAPGCARMTEYALYAELAGARAAAAVPVRLVGDALWWPDGPRATGVGLALEDDVVPVGGVLRGHAARPAEVGAELHHLSAAPRFLPVATVEGDFAITLPRDVPPSLHDGEDLGIGWIVRAGDAFQRFAVVDPDGLAGERRPPLLTFLAQLARDPFALRR